MGSMKEKLRAHYLKLGPRLFVSAAVITLLALDLINSWYMKLYWVKKDISSILIRQSARQSGLIIEDFNADTLFEMTSFINNMFYFFIFIIITNNLFFYFFYLRKRLWAQGYILVYTLSAAIFSMTFIFDNAGLGPLWMSYNILTIFIYAYVYAGVKLLKPETTLASGKKGQ